MTPPYRRLNIHHATADLYEHHAEAMDLATTTLVDAVLRGAIRTGQVQRLAALVLADQDVRRRARPAARPWEPTGPTTSAVAAPTQAPPAEWASGPWRLRRDRPTRGGDRAGQWWLHGPGLPEEGWPTGHGKRSEAQRAADARIATLEAQAPIRVDGEPERPQSPAERARELAARVHPEAEG
jgi:hypothetical protein